MSSIKRIRLKRPTITAFSLSIGRRQRISCKLYSVTSSGPFGVEGRLPTSHLINQDTNSSLCITDPLQVYQNYVTSGVLKADEQQLRAAKEFQKLYYRVKDYRPPEELQIKISLILKRIELKYQNNESYSKNTILNNILLRNPKRLAEKNKNLIKIITDEEELANFPSPHGLLLNGEVGCGKSMLMDMFANTLPHHSKMRWHYNNFILWVYDEIHKIQQQRRVSPNLKLSLENEFILFEIAQKMINRNTILLLDEFVLPDIASANIIKILMTFFFKLGGVLVATSNKLPEELYSNSFKKKSFKNFVSILQSRCYSLDMKSSNDYRKILSAESKTEKIMSFNISKFEHSDHEQRWNDLLSTTIDLNEGNPSTLTVYGRKIFLPWTSDGVVKFDFDYICRGLFASSDYISLASNYHTFIIDNVPIMTIKMKNEARRFITLLDAIYEAKCRLYLRTEVNIDDLFFPDSSQLSNIIEQFKTRNFNPGFENPCANNAAVEETSSSSNRLQVQDEEMFARTQNELQNPYRPNVSSYDQEHASNFEYKDVSTSFDGKTKSDLNFQKISAFTGEDEKFAYKRAVSRIKEMTGSKYWRMDNKWVPIDNSMRPWETKYISKKETDANIDSYNFSLDSLRIEDTLTDLKIEQLIKSNKSVREITNKMLVNTLPKDFSEGHDIPFRKFNEKFAPVFENFHFWSVGIWGKGSKLKDEIAKKWIKGNRDK